MNALSSNASSRCGFCGVEIAAGSKRFLVQGSGSAGYWVAAANKPPSGDAFKVCCESCNEQRRPMLPPVVGGETVPLAQTDFQMSDLRPCGGRHGSEC